MMRKMMRAGVLALAGLSFVAALVGCGKQGDLERPAPMFAKAKTKAAYAAQQADQAAAASNAAEVNRTIAPQNPAVQPYTNPAPIHDVPIPGEPTPPESPEHSGGPQAPGGPPPQ